MSFPNRGEGGGVPHLGKIPTFSSFFIWGASLRAVSREYFLDVYHCSLTPYTAVHISTRGGLKTFSQPHMKRICFSVLGSGLENLIPRFETS